MFSEKPFELFIFTLNEKIPDEDSHINFFLDKGASAVYLRKEHYSKESIELFFQKIKAEHHQKIMLPFSVVDDAIDKKYKPILHIKEKERAFVNLHQLPADAIISTSIHDFSDMKKISDRFRYVFYSPVFESISKPNYKPNLFFEEIKKGLGKRERGKEKLIALGGIKEENILRVKEAGFDGAALLGAIWENKNPKELFLRIYSNACSNLKS